MIFSIYSIRDSYAGFMTPVLEQSDIIAMRNFQMACISSSSDKSLISFRPSDFSLFRIGIFDSETGVISPLNPIEQICVGSSFKEDYNKYGL